MTESGFEKSLSPPSVIDPSVYDLIMSIKESGGRSLLVGGWVRDHLLGIHSKDLDIEVFQMPLNRLKTLCRKHGRLITVGASFAVLKLTFPSGDTVDVSVPRREKQTGEGHRAFEIQADPYMPVEEAAQRRDLTVNAISMDPLTGVIIDPTGGVRDLNARCLRHVGTRFSEDPLRVLRVYQFMARLGFSIAPETRRLCRKLIRGNRLQSLARERIEDEMKKMVSRGQPDGILKAFRLMRDDGVIRSIFPELHRLGRVRQDRRYHAEGDALEHTFRAVSAASAIARRESLSSEDTWLLCVAALIHDLGKADTTTVQKDGKITSHGHDKAGLEPAEKLLDRITHHHKIRDAALALLKCHMRPLQLAKAGNVSDAAIQRLADDVQPSSLEMLSLLVESDTQASIRGDGSEHENAHIYLRKRSRELGVDHAPPKPFIQGRDLMILARKGVLPEPFLQGGPHFSEILNLLYEKQLNREFADRSEAMAFLKNRFRLASDGSET